MTGQIFILLTIGISAAAILSLIVADHIRKRELESFYLQRVIASAEDITNRIQQDPRRVEWMLSQRLIMGAKLAPAGIVIDRRDDRLEALLASHFGPHSRPEAGKVPTGICIPIFLRRAPEDRAAGQAGQAGPDCWIVRLTDDRGQRRALALDLPQMSSHPSPTLNPLWLALIIMFSAALSITVARYVARPLRKLERAAEAFSLSLDPEPIHEQGPEEVRAALSTFNLMQQRVRAGYRERTQLLAAITHDLQTPMTRLRLRLEQVEDEALRARLIQDHRLMLDLVREGLDLATSVETQEEWSIVDIDSLLASIAEDAQDVGQSVEFVSGCGGNARVKLNALGRCLDNLVDNALRYGVQATLSSIRKGEWIAISICDAGPGIAEPQLEKMFEPFKRGAAGQPGGREGTGIGLTIARSLAMTFGGTVTLSNRPEGGLKATIEWKG